MEVELRSTVLHFTVLEGDVTYSVCIEVEDTGQVNVEDVYDEDGNEVNKEPLRTEIMRAAEREADRLDDRYVHLKEFVQHVSDFFCHGSFGHAIYLKERADNLLKEVG